MPRGKKIVRLTGTFPANGPWTHLVTDEDGNVAPGSGGMWAVDGWMSQYAKRRDPSTYEIQVTAPAGWFKMEDEEEP